MDNFTFYNPTRVIFGKDTIPRIGPAIQVDALHEVTQHQLGDVKLG